MFSDPGFWQDAEMSSSEIPMRWRDLDTLKHVNNVTYLDYALELWPDLRANGLIPQDDPQHVRVDYRLPLHKSDDPIHIDSSVVGRVLTQHIYEHGAEQPAAIVAFYFDAAIETAEFEPAAPTRELMLRYSDLDVNRRINIARVFELFQESRVRFVNEILREARIPAVVIARADVHIIESIRWQTAPLTTQTWVKRVGGSSFVLRAQLSVGESVKAVAETVMVAFDAETQKSAALNDEQREDLRKLMVE